MMWHWSFILISMPLIVGSVGQGNVFASTTSPGAWGNPCLMVERLQAKAQQGDQEAQYTLGKMYSSIPWGDEQSIQESCVLKDSQKAIHWFTKAAKAGNEQAGFQLGLMYESGLGVKENLVMAEKWWLQVAQKGNREGMLALGKLYLKGPGNTPKYSAALEWFKKAQEKSKSEAAYRLSEMYSQGLGVKEDQSLAMKWLQKAAKGGWIEALFQLGVRQFEGRGITKDTQAGLALIQQEANFRRLPALIWLGRALLLGKAIPQDKQEGKQYLAKAFLLSTTRGHVDETKTLLVEGFGDPNAFTQRPVYMPDRKEMNLMIRAGKGPEMEQVPVLGWAAERGQVEIVTILLDHGAKVNAKRTKTRKTALWSASKNGHHKVVQRLLKSGADPNLLAHDQEDGDQTALDMARNKHHQRVVALLESAQAKSSGVRVRKVPVQEMEKVEVEYRRLETNVKLSSKQVKARAVATPLPDRVQILVKEAKMAMPSSPWLEAEKARYQGLLRQGTYDVLVVPMQVQHYGIDPIGRSLMTHYLVKALRQRTSLHIPNPLMVQKALGEHARTYQPEKVYQLANALHVKKLVWLFGGHDRSSELRVTLQVQNQDRSGLHAASRMVQWDSASLPFSDTRPPEEAFQPLVEKMVKYISPKAKPSLPTRSAKREMLTLPVPSSPKEILSAKPDIPEVAAYQLQLLGAMFPFRTERAREHLFERSLVALTEVNSQSPEYPILKGRALFYLHRRPAALEALKHNQSPEARALRAALNGNLPALEQESRKIQAPLKRLLAQIETVDLRWDYKGYEIDREALQAMAEEFPGWETLILRRLLDVDLWHRQSNTEIKQMLDAEFPIPGKSFEEIIQHQMIFKGRGPQQSTLDFLPMTHVHELFRMEPKRWCCEKSLGVPQELDVATLLASLAESNLVKAVGMERDLRGQVESAKHLLDGYMLQYEGHPLFAGYRAKTFFEFSLMNSSGSFNPAQVQEFYVQEATRSLWGAGGQTRFAAEMLWDSMDAHSKLKRAQVPISPQFIHWFQWYGEDVPRRGYWPSFESPLRVMDRKYDENLIEELKYTTTNISILKALYERSPAELPAKSVWQPYPPPQLTAQSVWQQNQHRFDGHPDRLAFLAQVNRIDPDSSEMEQLYLAAIKKKVEEWKPYVELGSRYVEQGKFQLAQQTFQQYPGFQGEPRQNRVGLSNHAYLAGSYLFWRGAYAEAEPFYQYSADLETGSSASLTSEARMALVKGEYLKSAKKFLTRARRYEDHYAYRDYLTLLHLLGFAKEAWTGFDGLRGKFESPSIWTAAFVGHRLQGTPPEQIAEWLREQHAKRPAHPFRSIPARYALMIHLVDRVPNETLVPLIAELEKGYEARVDSNGTVMNRVNRWIGPSDYKGSAMRVRPLKQTPESELVLFAKGYQALQNKDYQLAMKWFEERAKFYTYYEEDFGGYALPYFAWASVKSKQTTAMKGLLKNYERPSDFRRFKKEFDYYLAEAFMAGGESRHEEAVEHLKAAFNRRPHTEMRPIFSWYQIVEACEWLYEESKQQVYQDMALQWAKDYQVIQPMFAWAYAVEAKYTQDASARQRALAFALHLDRHSERIAKFSKAEKDKAREWFKQNNPFVISPKAAKTAA